MQTAHTPSSLALTFEGGPTHWSECGAGGAGGSLKPGDPRCCTSGAGAAHKSGLRVPLPNSCRMAAARPAAVLRLNVSLSLKNSGSACDVGPAPNPGAPRGGPLGINSTYSLLMTPLIRRFAKPVEPRVQPQRSHREWGVGGAVFVCLQDLHGHQDIPRRPTRTSRSSRRETVISAVIPPSFIRISGIYMCGHPVFRPLRAPCSAPLCQHNRCLACQPRCATSDETRTSSSSLHRFASSGSSRQVKPVVE